MSRQDDLIAKAEGIVDALRDAPATGRADLHVALHDCLRALRTRGVAVPAHLHAIDLALTDEEVEDNFDNMPV